MMQAIRGLAVAGLVTVAMAAWQVFAPAGVLPLPHAIVSYLPEFILVTSTLLGFSAGLLTLTLTLPRRQRLWSAALLASLILNGYWTLASTAFWWTFVPQPRNPMPHLLFTAANVITYGIAPAAPALVALGYTFRAARLVPQAAHAAGAQGDLDIRPMEGGRLGYGRVFSQH